MPRMARVVIPGIAHHVTQRGHRREDVFFSDADRRRYLELLGQYASEHALAVQAYCLMTNHLHLIVVPATPESLSRALKPVHLRYAQETNHRRQVSGVLWGGRFFSCPLDERHFWSAVRYVERNPVRAGLERQAWRYPWSSAAAHCGLRRDPLLSGELEQSDEIGHWQSWLCDEDDEEALATLRRCTRTGRPAGGESFVKKLEALCGRLLRPKPAGRRRRKGQAGHPGEECG